MRALFVLAVALTAIGCYHDKYNIEGQKKEDYVMPPDEARFNEPEKATFRPKPPEKQQDTLMNGKGGPVRPAGGINGL
jgi:hypothetical protein